ncbi:hypothetical protein [Streptomyces sp. B1I3]
MRHGYTGANLQRVASEASMTRGPSLDRVQ